MAGNIGVELNLSVGKTNPISPNFIPPTYNTCIVDTFTECTLTSPILNLTS